MGERSFLAEPVSPPERAGVVLGRLQQQFRYAAALITCTDVGGAGETALVNHRYRPEVVEHVLNDLIPRHPAFRTIAAHPERVFHWDSLPSFRSTSIAQDVLMPRGYRQGTSLVLHDRCGTAVGTVHFSLEEETFPDRAVELLALVRTVLGDIVASHRDRARAGLSPREAEILCLVAAGLSNVEIAEKVFVSRRTVATHVEHILRKLGAANRVQAALQAVAFGLVAPDCPAATRAMQPRSLSAGDNGPPRYERRSEGDGIPFGRSVS